MAFALIRRSDSGLHDVSTLFGLTGGQAYLRVFAGWVYLLFQNVTVAGTGTVVLTANGFAAVCPQAPIASAEGTVITAASVMRRVEANRNGQVRLIGVGQPETYNGTVIWPMTRPMPTTFPGVKL